MLEGLLKMREAQEAKPKEELQASQNTMQGLEAQVKEIEEKLNNNEAHASELEARLANTTTKRLY